MAKIKLTKNELKKQKDELKRFERFLPTLQLKKQQIQMELMKAKKAVEEKVEEEETHITEIKQWIAVLGEDAGITDLIKIDFIETDVGNIAGVDIPIFKEIRFKAIKYDLYVKPLWFDKVIEHMKIILTLRGEIIIMDEQLVLLQEELRITTQRVNLFEKLKIPESKENIRIIRIYLGDEETSAVVRGKIAKMKIEKAQEAKNLEKKIA
ncbi:MAG: V-type ATP synthase subunit D [Candidatus Aureabacteria bacterium]|nr:V-type ATP synthase subunit D [Candidatus Auribacterota bacterium]